MTATDHWDRIYEKRDPASVSWFQEAPRLSLDLIARTGVGPDARIVDVGAGASSLVDHLLLLGHTSLVVADVSRAALRMVEQRLGGRRPEVEFVVGDVLERLELGEVDLWHDRALFHFLTDPEDRSRYRDSLDSHVVPGGHVVLATFATDGPEQCSGLPTARYSAQELATAFSPGYSLVVSQDELHATPDGREQAFVYVLLRRDS